ncbi:MAG: hypothetical protein H0W84_03955 [Bacteroidetes bacterium]|nr:hypothetical protein [Bacteroidota bacterium]
MKTKNLLLIVGSLLFVTNIANGQWSLSGNALTGTAPNPTQYFGSSNGYNVVFKTGGVEKMRLSTSGNLRIGAAVTGLPGAKISFNDASDAVNGTGADGITWLSTAPLSYGIYKTAGSWASPNYQQLQLNWITGIILNPGNTANTKCYVDIQGGGLRVSSGNVGIGTLTPTNAKLVVQPATTVNNTPDNMSGLSIEKQTAIGTTRRMMMVPHLGGWGLNQLSRDGDFGMFWSDGIAGGGQNSTAAFVIAPWAFPNNGIRINANGNVGIGTALDVNPNNYKLAVNGTIGAKAVKVEISSTTWADYVF